MAVITEIAPVRHSPRQVQVTVDGRLVAKLSLASLQRLNLTLGLEWTPTLAQQVWQQQQVESAVQQAGRWIARRAMSQKQMLDKLQKAGHEPALAQQVLDRLKGLGLLDDRSLGQNLIDELRRWRQAGPLLLKKKLLDRGLDEELADRLIEQTAPQAVTDAHDPPSESGLLSQVDLLAKAKLALWSKLPWATRQRRLAGWLSRRGYDESTVQEVLERLGLLEPPDDESEPV